MSRIALVHQPTDGGVWRHVRDLAEGLVRDGHEVTLCGPVPPGEPISGAARRPLALQRAVDPRRDLACARELAAIVRELRPDVLHAHSSKAGAVARLARIAHPRIPLLYSPHGYAFAGHFERAAERRAYRLAERALAPLATRVVCVCEAEARRARSIGPGSRVRVVHNGVPPAPLAPADGPIDSRLERLAASGPVIGALTLMRPGKGLETLIDAAPAVLNRHPRAQLMIVGDGPEREALLTRAQARGVERAVHFLGPSAQPLEAMRGMDVLVHPSWAESFPYVVLEAMSLGLPIVASDVGGIGEALVDGQSGVLVAPRDAAALGDALADLLDRPELMARLGASALQRVGERFTLAGMVRSLEVVYREVIP